MSVARSSLTTAEQAFHLHTVLLSLPSEGTWAVSVAECGQHELRAFPDPLTSPPDKVADPAHAFVDFGGLSNSRVESKATQLRNDAFARTDLPSSGLGGGDHLGDGFDRHPS